MLPDARPETDGELYSAVVDGVERLVLWIDRHGPDPILKAGRYENGEAWVRAFDARDGKLLGYTTW